MSLRTKPRKEWEIKLEGNFEVERLLELKAEILGALEQCENLRLNLENVEEAGLGLLQLFCAAHLTAIGMGKGFFITGEIPEFFRHLAYEAGFSRHKGCGEENTTCCPWTRFYEAPPPP